MGRLPDKMSGVLLIGHGSPEMLEYPNDMPLPHPEPNDVVIRVSAAGVNNPDINTRTAWYSKDDNEDHDAIWSKKK